MKDRKIIKIGDSEKNKINILESNIVKFASISGDFNPIHLDRSYAKTTIFKKRIAHGMYVGSLISSVIAEKMPGRGSIYLNQSFKFLKPVYIGDSVTVHVEFIEIVDRKKMKLKTICFNQKSDIVVEGEALVLPPSNISIRE